MPVGLPQPAPLPKPDARTLDRDRLGRQRIAADGQGLAADGLSSVIRNALEEHQLPMELLRETRKLRGDVAVDQILRDAGLTTLGHRVIILNAVSALEAAGAAAVPTAAPSAAPPSTSWARLLAAGVRELGARLYFTVLPKTQDADHVRSQLSETMTVSALLSGFAVGMALSLSTDEMAEYARLTQSTFFGNSSALCTKILPLGFAEADNVPAWNGATTIAGQCSADGCWTEHWGTNEFTAATGRPLCSATAAAMREEEAAWFEERVLSKLAAVHIEVRATGSSSAQRVHAGARSPGARACVRPCTPSCVLHVHACAWHASAGRRELHGDHLELALRDLHRLDAAALALAPLYAPRALDPRLLAARKRPRPHSLLQLLPVLRRTEPRTRCPGPTPPHGAFGAPLRIKARGAHRFVKLAQRVVRIKFFYCDDYISDRCMVTATWYWDVLVDLLGVAMALVLALHLLLPVPEDEPGEPGAAAAEAAVGGVSAEGARSSAAGVRRGASRAYRRM